MNARRMLALAALAAIPGLALSASVGATEPRALAVGDRAPEFEGLADDGTAWKSGGRIGRKIVVVYFYPAAMTGGCTKQACSFRDSHSRLAKLGAEVVGVSGDRVANLGLFKAANRLNFPLLADSTGAIARAFGVPLAKGGSITRTVRDQKVELARDVTASRWTFVIGRDGRIAFVETEVNPESDGPAVVAAIERVNRQRR